VAVAYLQGEHHMSVRQACRLVRLSTSVLYYQHRRGDDGEVVDAINAILDGPIGYGFGKLYHKLREQGKPWNHKRVRRVYRKMHLHKRSRTRKRRITRPAQPLVEACRPNETWSLDFMHDRLTNGAPFRVLNIVDDFNREVLNITVDRSISSLRVVRELSQLIEWRGKPTALRFDNGPEFLSTCLQEFCAAWQIQTMPIQPGKPNQNAYIERFNRTYREDVLNPYLFETLEEVRKLSQEWQWQYNNERPHASLNQKTPMAYLLEYGKRRGRKSVEAFPTFQQDDDDDRISIFN
jgi:putative transposase